MSLCSGRLFVALFQWIHVFLPIFSTLFQLRYMATRDVGLIWFTMTEWVSYLPPSPHLPLCLYRAQQQSQPTPPERHECKHHLNLSSPLKQGFSLQRAQKEPFLPAAFSQWGSRLWPAAHTDTEWCFLSLRVLIAGPGSALAQGPVETVMALKSLVRPQASTQRPRGLPLK